MGTAASSFTVQRGPHPSQQIRLPPWPHNTQQSALASVWACKRKEHSPGEGKESTQQRPLRHNIALQTRSKSQPEIREFYLPQQPRLQALAPLQWHSRSALHTPRP